VRLAKIKSGNPSIFVFVVIHLSAEEHEDSELHSILAASCGLANVSCRFYLRKFGETPVTRKKGRKFYWGVGNKILQANRRRVRKTM
jgi:hypothetical protein